MLIKNSLKKMLERFGYQIRRVRARPKPNMNVFELLCSELNRKKAEIYFLQIGANDGLNSDPIRKYVRKYGWKGILVEPQPEVFNILKKNYMDIEGLIFENCAISAEREGCIEFFSIREPTSNDWNMRLTGLASLDRTQLEASLLAQGVENPNALIVCDKVPVWSGDSILERNNVLELDVLCIDAEGHDFQVLKSINLDKYKPKVVMLEIHNLSADEQIECIQRLMNEGYSVSQSLGDVIAARIDYFENIKA